MKYRRHFEANINRSKHHLKRAKWFLDQVQNRNSTDEINDLENALDELWAAVGNYFIARTIAKAAETQENP